MKYFYDTEFIERGPDRPLELISIGIVDENGRAYYAISTEFKARHASQWVKDNVLTHLPPRHVNMSDLSESPRLKEESRAWKSRTQIKSDLLEFVGVERPEFWGYYSAYDHVALCQLFGTMMDLPKGWPMFTRDLIQECKRLGNPKLPEQGKGEHHALADARWNKQVYEFLSARPDIGNTDFELPIRSGGEDLRVCTIMDRFRNDGSCDHIIERALIAMSRAEALSQQQREPDVCGCKECHELRPSTQDEEARDLAR